MLMLSFTFDQYALSVSIMPIVSHRLLPSDDRMATKMLCLYLLVDFANCLLQTS